MDVPSKTNKVRAALHRKRFKVWKSTALQRFGYFPVFQPFRDTFLLRNLSGNAVKLYIYLGLMSGNDTGETWVTVETISAYFGKTTRAVSEWIRELENVGLLDRFQLKPNEAAHTFLVPYGLKQLNQDKALQKGSRNGD